MKKKFILMFVITLAMGMTACSSESKGDAVSVETDSRQETDKEAEGEPSIAVGDKVEISYRGLIDFDEEHPSEAVKIVVITVD